MKKKTLKNNTQQKIGRNEEKMHYVNTTGLAMTVKHAGVF